ncbi:Transmembrane and ubiquitin-like domain-containing protein 1 [Nymphon striatum]|nr:Transmembrane and ubiquitin-like domain-containing protein 1 [Nymphon striatum]
MTLLEGFGDEVVIFFTIAALVVTLIVIWISTVVVTPPTDIHHDNHDVVGLGDDGDVSSNDTVPVTVNNSDYNDAISSPSSINSTVPGSTEVNPANLLQSEAQLCNNANENRIENEANSCAESKSENNEVPHKCDTNSSANSIQDSKSEEKSSSNLDTVSSTFNETKSASIEENGESTQSKEEVNNRIKIRIKYLNDSQAVADANLNEHLEEFKKRQFAEDLENNKQVKLIFNGRLLLGDHLSLEDHGLFDNCVVHYFTISLPNQNAASQNFTASIDENRGLNVGNMLMPLLGLILAILWYGRIHYDIFFNGLATFLLMSFTVMFSAFLFATFTSSNPNQSRNTSHGVQRTNSN